MIPPLRDFSCVYLLVILYSFPNQGSAATSLTDKIYYDLDNDGFAMCFRRFNATHQIGCSSDRGGNVGVVHLVRNNSDLKWLEKDGPHPPYIAVIDAHMFDRDAFDRLVKCGKVNGLVVIYTNETDQPDMFSPDTSCPNEHSGLYSKGSDYGSCRKVSWNPLGNGMMFENVPFPMVTISNKSDISFIIQDCYEKFNTLDVANMPKGYSLCAMEIKDVMDGAKDTPTCHRRTKLVNNLNPQGYCDPLKNLNIYSYMDSLNKSRELNNNSVIVIGARLDAFSLFDHHYPGYDSAVLGFITVHAIAEALGKVRHQLLDAVYDQPIVFALFHGEAFDYIGSSRMVYDIEERKFLPVTLESIGTFIEIGQVGLHNASDLLWVHSDPISIRSEDVRNRVKSLTEQVMFSGQSVGLNVRRASEEEPLPPASLQQFLKSPKSSIAGILLSNHEKGFSNSHYNSMFDTSSDTLNASDPDAYSNITPDVDHLQKIATAIARTVYGILLGNTSDLENVNANNITIANLIYCFTKNSDCELLNATSEYGKSSYLLAHNYYLSRYVGVQTSESIQVAKHHQFLLAHFLGSMVENVTTAESCHKLTEKNDGFKYVFLNGFLNASDNATRIPVCLKSSADTSDALSPAFLIDDYDWSSNNYPAWTESRWDTSALQMRVFLMPNPGQEIVTLCIGIGVFILSSGLVCLVQRKSGTLFVSTDV